MVSPRDGPTLQSGAKGLRDGDASKVAEVLDRGPSLKGVRPRRLVASPEGVVDAVARSRTLRVEETTGGRPGLRSEAVPDPGGWGRLLVRERFDEGEGGRYPKFLTKRP